MPDLSNAPDAAAANEPGRESLWPRVAGRYLFPLLCALMLARLAFAAARIGLALPERWDASYPEGAVPARAWDAARGLPVYGDWRAWPHAFAPYSPLTYYIPAWIARAARATDHPWNLYLIGRAQSLASICALGLAVGWLARRAGASGAWRLLAVCAFFSWDPLLKFTASYRPDGPMAALSLAAILIATGGPATAARAIAALGCLSAAWWFKATPWGTTALIGWWLLRSSPRRAVAIGAGAGAAAVNLALAFGLNARTQGFLFMNMAGSLNNGWRPANFLIYLSGLHIFPVALTLFGAGAAGSALLGARREGLVESGGHAFARRWLARGVLLSLASSLIQLLKDGADFYYLLEPFALGCAMAAPAIERGWARGPAIEFRSARKGAAFFGLLLWAALGGGTMWDCGRSLSRARAEIRTGLERRRDIDVSTRAAGIEGPIFAMNPYVALRRPAPPTVLDLFQWNILARRGLLDPAPLLDRLKSERFAAVIVSPRYIRMDRPTRFIEPLKIAIHTHYEKAEDHGVLWLMLPRGRPE